MDIFCQHLVDIWQLVTFWGRVIFWGSNLSLLWVNYHFIKSTKKSWHGSYSNDWHWSVLSFQGYTKGTLPSKHILRLYHLFNAGEEINMWFNKTCCSSPGGNIWKYGEKSNKCDQRWFEKKTCFFQTVFLLFHKESERVRVWTLS